MLKQSRGDSGRRRFLTWRRLALGALLLATASAAGFGAWLYSLPEGVELRPMQAIPEQESQAMLQALKPPKRNRPVIAVIGINNATETTDYLMPYGILKRANVADVMTLATHSGAVKLYPVLSVLPDATTAAFDHKFPDGADYVIVPAMNPENDPAALAWIRDQARKGAIIIAVCAGAKVAANAGLLENRRATTHWYYLKGMLEEHPSIRHVPNRRFVIEPGVATTTGISASMPMMVTLIEAIAGEGRARSVAKDLGISTWDARHQSDVFGLNRPFVWSVLKNRAAFWNHERLGIELVPGVDEVSLALVADSWSRTYRSGVTTFARSAEPVATRNGARIVPADVRSVSLGGERLITIGDYKPAQALNMTLKEIAGRYGPGTARVVAHQLEYPLEQ